MFTLAGRSFESAMSLVTKVYSMMAGLSIRITEGSEGRRVVALRDIWSYPDCYHVGLFEAAMSDYGHTGIVKVRSISLTDVDLEVTWE